MGRFGCCAGDTFGGGGNSSFGPTNIDPGGGKSAKGEPYGWGCDPNSVNFSDFISHGGPQGPGWKAWTKKKGCGFISLLMMNEINHGIGKQPHFPQIFTPGNVEYLRKCLQDCTKALGYPGGWDASNPNRGRGGVPNTGWGIQCWMACKKMLMHTKYNKNIDARFFTWGKGGGGPGGPGNVDPSATPGGTSIGGKLCPPLCTETEVIIWIMLGRKMWDPNTGKLLSPPDDVQYSPHIVRGKVQCCSQGKKICFDVQDYVPQSPQAGRICVGSDGTLIHIPDNELGPGGKNYGGDIRHPGGADLVLKKGACEACMKSIGCRGSLPKGKYCQEMSPADSYIAGIYTESRAVDCPQRAAATSHGGRVDECYQTF